MAEDRRPELLEEYRSLREEMLNRAKRADDVLVYSIIGTAALLGYGFTLKVSYIFLLPFSIIIPLSDYIRRTHDQILFMAAYILVVIEQQTNLRWETVLFNFRKQEALRGRFTPNMLEYILIYDFLSLVCIGASFFSEPASIGLVLVVSLMLLYLIWWNYKMWGCYSFRRQKEYETKIRQVLAKM